MNMNANNPNIVLSDQMQEHAGRVRRELKLQHVVYVWKEYLITDPQVT